MTGALIARHNAAIALREAEQFEAALAEFDAIIAAGLHAPETLTMRAHLLADLGRYEAAVAQYRAVLAAHPEMLDAHETLAKLLPQLGREDEALDSYRAALARCPRNGPLRVAALGMARGLLRFDVLRDWAREAEAIFGHDTMITVFEAEALAALGEVGAARDRLIAAVRADSDYVPAHIALAHVLLKGGDAQGAEAAALEATRRAPLDQSGWALLAVAWRLLDDPREHWLCDYDALVMPITLEAIDWRALARVLDARHDLTQHPAEQSLRGGTQTRGALFARRDPAIMALAATIKRAVEARIAALPADPSHPFLGRRRGRIEFSGSWSVRLRSAGFHISHIHPQGWLSSACYVALPTEMGVGDAGALTFGVPDAALGLDLPPRRIVRPRVGQLVVFPSYLWHGTIPFESPQARLTVAFDALPVDKGAVSG